MLINYHRVQLNHWQPSSRTNHRPRQDLGPSPHTPGGSLTPFCHENMISRFQAIAQTLARDALRTVWDLAARIITTATLFGVFESVEKQINHCHFLMFCFRFLKLWQTQPSKDSGDSSREKESPQSWF